MAADTLKSGSITNWDANPVVTPTRGSGASAYRYTIEDTVAPTAVGIATAASTYRIVRIPVNAKVKGVKLAISRALDTGTPALIMDLNLAFSDSTVDGTPSGLQGLIPTSANTGATTTVASYSSPNIIFGSTTTAEGKTGLVAGYTDFIFNGSQTNYPMATVIGTELWSIFGFTNTYGTANDPGGFFDLMAYVSTAANAGQSGTLLGSIDFVV